MSRLQDNDPTRWADDAAEAIRALNHATLPAADAVTGPADVYLVLGSLSLLAGRLPQTLAHLQGFLERELAVDRIRIVDGDLGGDPTGVVAEVARWIDVARGGADTLRAALDHAHATLTWAAGRAVG